MRRVTDRLSRHVTRHLTGDWALKMSADIGCVTEISRNCRVATTCRRHVGVKLNIGGGVGGMWVACIDGMRVPTHKTKMHY